MPARRPSEPRYLEFEPGQPAEVVATMDALAAARRGWVNFEPAVHPDDVAPAGGGFFGVFSGRGPDVPLATWTAPTASRRGRGDPAMIGLQHGAGRRIKAHLAEMGHPLPDGWVVDQDYVRKGLVVSVPPGTANADVLEWLLGAARAVSSVPLTGTWRASIYEG